MFAAIALIAVLLVSACTSGDEATPTPTPEPTATATATPTPTATPEPTPEPVVVTDSDGVELTLEVPPTRIISFSPGATEILFAIGAGDQVVAVDEWANYPPETENLERVKYIDPDPERVLSLDPDLLLMATAQQPQVEQLRSLDLQVMFNLEPDSIQGVLDNILLLGLITGHTEEAEALVADIEARIALVEAAIADIDEGPRVFYELSNDLYTVAPDTFIGGTLTLLKAQNVAAGAKSAFPQLTAEALIEANPEVVLLADAAWGESLETVSGRPGWDVVDAVVNERVFGVDPDTGNRPGPRIIDSIEEIAALLYPERFP
jgi:cobalamin transport system substrate-binding protein